MDKSNMPFPSLDEKMKKIILMFLLALAIFSCTPSVDFMRYSEEIYPPTNKIEVIRNKPVERDFVEIGELSVEKQENAILLLKEKAKEIGADAIIILGEKSDGGFLLPTPYIYLYSDETYIAAIAIKYKN